LQKNRVFFYVYDLCNATDSHSRMIGNNTPNAGQLRI